MEGKTTCGISAIIKATGMHRKDILAHIETGKIRAAKQGKQGKQFAFPVTEKERLESLHNTYIGFFSVAQCYVSGENDFSFGKRKCRDALLEFMTENSWFGCPNPDRSCCIGCGYEIYTKTILRLLVSECLRLREKKKTVEKSEAVRCDTLLKKGVLPAISEILTSAERFCPEAELKPLIKEIEGRLHSC